MILHKKSPADAGGCTGIGLLPAPQLFQAESLEDCHVGEQGERSQEHRDVFEAAVLQRCKHQCHCSNLDGEVDFRGRDESFLVVIDAELFVRLWRCRPAIAMGCDALLEEIRDEE